jgi:hypothetical protein
MIRPVRLRLVVVLALAAASACDRRPAPAAEAGARAAEGGTDASGTPTELGRTYSAWLVAGDHARLWSRFGPELRQDFGNEDSLRRYISETVTALGAEQGEARERLDEAIDTVQVYSRVVRFARAPQPMMVQWSLTRDGAISGFMLRPAPERDSAPRVQGPQ